MTDQITSRQDFADFVNKLHRDLQTNPTTWTNVNLSDFLEAMSRYTEDIGGYYKNTNQNVNADNASWRVFADILMGAKMYE